MIEAYFRKIEADLAAHPDVSYTKLETKTYNMKQGCITASVTFLDGSRLEFMEVKNTDCPAKTKYRYHYMNRRNQMIFRYDNAPHQREIPTFPHHKHEKDRVLPSDEPTLQTILREISLS